jgi:hypothetical protein
MMSDHPTQNRGEAASGLGQSAFDRRAYEQALAIRLKEALRRHGVREAARDFATSPENIRRWTSGEARPPAWFLAVVSHRLKVDARFLLLGLMTEKPDSPRENRDSDST